MRLVTIDPAILAHAILKMKDDDALRQKHIALGLEETAKYKWGDARKKMNQIIIDTVKRDRESMDG
jgi:hypothetical protein